MATTTAKRIRGNVERVLQYMAFLFVNMPTYVLGAALRRVKGRPLEGGDLDKEQIRAILVIRVDGLGDVVLLSTFLRGLRRAFPDAWITLVVDRKVLAMVDLCPWVNQVLGFNEQGNKYKRLVAGGLRAWRLAAEHLHQRHFDLAITPRWDVDSRAGALLGYFSMARWHLGFSEAVNENKARINRGADRLYSHLATGSRHLVHELDRNNEVLTSMNLPPDTGRPELWLSDGDIRWGEEVLREARAKAPDYIVCFGIGGVEAKRLWPIERYNAIASWLITHMNSVVVIIGDSRDRQAAEPMAQGPLRERVVNLAGTCSLRRSASVLRHCDLFVGNDSGPMHLAAAAAVPVIEISCHPLTGQAGHVNSPLRYKPVGVTSRILQPRSAQHPCDGGCEAPAAHCIREIEVDEVKTAILEVLAREQNWARESATRTQQV